MSGATRNECQIERLVTPRVAVLCVAPNSIYKTMPDVDAYDMKRDARTYTGNLPVVAHPPCRAWSAFCAHQAKPEPGEKELGLWCADKLRELGGVLEHPAHSRLFDAAGLPKPGEHNGEGLRTLEVWQAWWGYPMKKSTWLCFAGVDIQELVIPFRLHDKGMDRRRQQLMSKHERTATTPEFARWLIEAAALAA